jgi:hypothetical protein
LFWRAFVGRHGASGQIQIWKGGVQGLSADSLKLGWKKIGPGTGEQIKKLKELPKLSGDVKLDSRTNKPPVKELKP